MPAKKDTNAAVAVDEKTGTITITIDTARDLGPSSSGKTMLVASTGGFQDVEGVDVRLNLTATRSR